MGNTVQTVSDGFGRQAIGYVKKTKIDE